MGGPLLTSSNCWFIHQFHTFTVWTIKSPAFKRSMVCRPPVRGGGGVLRQAEHDTDAQSWIRFFGGVESPLLPHRLLSLSMPPP